MACSSQHQPLPVMMPLSGKKRFPGSLNDQHLTWFLRRGQDHFPSQELGTGSLPFQRATGIKPGFQSGRSICWQPETLEGQALLIDFAWDWVEYCYQPLPNLQVRAVHWSPDPRVVCGLLYLSSQTPLEQEVIIYFQPWSPDQRVTETLHPARSNGRTILSGRIGRAWAGFLLAEGSLEQNPPSALTTTTTLQKDGQNQVRWIFSVGSSAAEVKDHLERALELDWEGEIARKKVLQQSRPRVETGNPEVDLLLAANQNLAHRIFETLSREKEENDLSPAVLSPLQAWQLYQSLFLLNTGDLKRFLNLAFPASLREREEDNDSPPFEPELPLHAALLWEISRSGHSPQLWRKYLPILEAGLEAWFEPDLDRDGDGIPAIRYPGLFQVLPAGEPSNQSLVLHQGFCLLEHPGLAALLINEIEKLALLGEVVGRDPLPPIWKTRKIRLEEYIKQSWLADESRFQSRQTGTHNTHQGATLVPALPCGWHSLQLDLSQPSQVIVKYHNLNPGQGLTRSRIILHGKDWNGSYRVEEIQGSAIDWERKIGAAVSESVFSRLDFISITGLDQNSQIKLELPDTDPKDITHLLPLFLSWQDLELMIAEKTDWLGCLGKLISNLGLKTVPGPGGKPVQLPWNILVAQALLEQGHYQLVDQLKSGWIHALGKHFQAFGNHLSAWDSLSGQNRGRVNTIESIFPVRLLLKLAGIGLQAEGLLTYESLPQTNQELRLTLRGSTVLVDRDQLKISRPGKNPILAPPDKKLSIQL